MLEAIKYSNCRRFTNRSIFVPKTCIPDHRVPCTLTQNARERREMVDEEEQARAAGSEEYLNEADPSILRFLIASRDVASAQQLRDDLLSMLVAGHETTASVLTWTVYLLCQNPEAMRKVQVRLCCWRLRSFGEFCCMMLILTTTWP